MRKGRSLARKLAATAEEDLQSLPGSGGLTWNSLHQEVRLIDIMRDSSARLDDDSFTRTVAGRDNSFLPANTHHTQTGKNQQRSGEDTSDFLITPQKTTKRKLNMFNKNRKDSQKPVPTGAEIIASTAKEAAPDRHTVSRHVALGMLERLWTPGDEVGDYQAQTFNLMIMIKGVCVAG